MLVLLVACTHPASDFLAPVESMLVEMVGQASFGGKVFCAYDVLGSEVSDETADVYVWALCGEYYLDQGALTLGTASSLPVALHMQKSNGEYRLTGHEVPGDGTAYMPSIRRIFPADAIQKMCHEDANCYNERAWRLQGEIERKAGEYYGLK